MITTVPRRINRREQEKFDAIFGSLFSEYFCKNRTAESARCDLLKMVQSDKKTSVYFRSRREFRKFLHEPLELRTTLGRAQITILYAKN